MEPSARKQKILATIVESYIENGEPVGSKSLISETGLGVSSATVRNDMADLTARGYLIQPHTSAGRVPTALGYRYYIDNVMEITPVASTGRAYISDRLREFGESPESILQTAAELTGQLTDCVALATTPCSDNSRVRKISFVQTGAHTAMAVVMTSDGIIKTKLFRCEFLITPEILGVFDKALNELFQGVALSAVNRPFIQTAAVRFGELSLFMPSALLAIKQACDLAGTVSICHSSYNRLLFAPQQNAAAAHKLLEFLQNEHDLAAMLSRLPLQTAVTLGKENKRTELSSGAVISTRYAMDGEPSGTLAVIGPLRMHYARNISILECVAACAGELMNELNNS